MPEAKVMAPSIHTEISPELEVKKAEHSETLGTPEDRPSSGESCTAAVGSSRRRLVPIVHARVQPHERRLSSAGRAHFAGNQHGDSYCAHFRRTLFHRYTQPETA